MGEMVERVAEAIARGRSEGGRKLFVGWANLDPYDKDMWRSAARAAIEAMREPTSEMANAGVQAYDDFGLSIPAIWRAMIDEALT